MDVSYPGHDGQEQAESGTPGEIVKRSSRIASKMKRKNEEVVITPKQDVSFHTI